MRGRANAAETLGVILELVRRGYTDEQIRKLWGGNCCALWRENERVARTLQ